MDFEDFLKKYLDEDESDSSTSTTAGTSSFDEFVKKHTSEYYVDEAYINTFIDDANSFLKNIGTDYESVGWSNAASEYKRIQDKIRDLTDRSTKIRGYLTENKNSIDADAYRKIWDFTDNIQESFTTIGDAYKGKLDSTAKYDTEDAYNQAVEEAKQQQEMLGLDNNAAQKEIDDMQKLLKDAEEWLKGQGSGQVQKILNDAGFESIDDLKAKIGEKQSYLNTAKDLQALYDFYTVFDPNSENYDPDFEKYTGYAGSTRIESWWDSIWTKDKNANMNTGYEDIRYDFINDPDTITKYLGKSASSQDAQLLYGLQHLKNMTEDQVKTYNYYYNKFGREAADKYLAVIEPYLQEERARIFAEKHNDTAMEWFFSASSGINSFIYGVKNLDNYILGTEADPAHWSQYAQQKMSANNTGFWKGFNDVAYTTGNMLPSVLVGSLTGGLGGAITMGLSATGNAYAEMRNLGYSAWQARGYATLVGASETALSYLLGGISKLAKGGGSGIFQTFANKLLPKFDHALARFAIQMGGNMIDEGLEEAIQTVLEPAFKALVTGEKFEAPEWEEVFYNGLLGSLTAGFMEGIPATIETSAQIYNNHKAGKAIMNTPGGVEALQDIGYQAARYSDPAIQQMLNRQANKLNKPSAQKVGTLYRNVSSSVEMQSHADIVKTLTRGENGFSQKKATEIADALIAQANGSELTKKQTKLLESIKDNPKVQQAVDNVLNNEKSTANHLNRQMEGLTGAVNLWTEMENQKKNDAKKAKKSKSIPVAENQSTETIDAVDDTAPEATPKATPKAAPKADTSVKEKTGTVEADPGSFDDILNDYTSDPAHDVVASSSRYKSAGEAIANTYDSANQLSKLAKSVAQKTSGKTKASLDDLIQKVAANPNSKNSGALYETVRNAVREMNHSELVQSLTSGENAFSEQQANAIAEALLAKVETGKVSNKQAKLLDSVKNNPKVLQAINEIRTNKDSKAHHLNIALGNFTIFRFQGGDRAFFYKANFSDIFNDTESQQSKPKEASADSGKAQQNKNAPKADTNSGKEKKAAKSSQEASADGKMVNTKTGDTIDPQGLVQAEDGTYMIATAKSDTEESSTDGFVGSNTGTTYNETQARLLASLSTEAIQNAADLSGRQDITGNHLGLGMDKQALQEWIDAGLAYIEKDADGNDVVIFNDAMLMDERERRHKAKNTTKTSNAVSNSEVSYADENQAIVYDTFVNLSQLYGKSNKVIANMDLDSRNALLGLYNPKINKDGGTFVDGILDAFFYGHRNVDLSAVGKDSSVWKLTEQQRKIAWNTGRAAGIQSTTKVQSNVDTVYAEAKNILDAENVEKGSYHAILADGIDMEQLNDKQNTIYQIADQIAQAIQTNIRLYAGTNKAQGFYNHATDEIWLNLNAAKTGREAIMAFTLAHELVHRSKKGSPAKYQAFVDFLMKEYGKQGSDVEAMIAEQIHAAEEFNKTVPEAQRVNMTREKALEEVVCDACQRMLLDTNAGQKLAEFGAQSKQNKGFLEDLKKWISELIGKLRRFFKNVDPDSRAAKEFAKFDKNVKQILADMYVDMSIDAGEKLSTIKAAYGGAFAEKFLGMKDIQYNLAATESHKEKLQKEYTEDSSTDIKTIMARYDKIIDIWTRLGGELNSKFLEDWNSKVGKDRTFTIFKAQAGYKYNVELSSMCKKGVPLFEAIDTIVKQEVMKELGTDMLGKAEKEILYDILKQHNFEIPCAICYVEQARQREGVIIDAFLNGKVYKNAKGETTKVKLGWNQVLDSIEKEMKANGVDYSFAQVSRDIATEKYTPAKIDMDARTHTAFFAALKKIANQEIARYNKAEGKSRKLLSEVTPEAVKECFKVTLPANLKIFKVLFEESSSRFKIQNDLLYSSVATQNLSMAHNKLYGLFNSQGGVSGYKTKQGTTIYWGDILGKSWKPDTLRNEGGVRNQSNSDFQMYTLLDQVQMYIDFTAKGYYLQAYTKVLSELKLFGLSRGKINASLIPKVVVYRNADGSVDIEKTMANAGLDENGNPIYDDIEGINHDEAFMLIEDPEYSKSICGICIGYSDAHINKLLDDPRVQQIIGFHDKTDDGTKRYKGARYAKNYNGLNEAVNKEGKTVHIGFNPYVKRAEKKFRFNAETETFEGTVNYNGKTYTADDIPRLAADLYLEMCAKKEYTPAYNDFSGHPNYYKLLADFGLYDSQGHYAPHRKVAYNMPDTVPYLDANGKKQTMKIYDYIKAELVKELTVRDSISEALADTSSEGIIPQFKAAVKKSQEEKSFSLPKVDSNGTQLSAEQQEFFKDSKVRDVDGNLMVMYHGSANGGAFTIFDGDKLGNDTRTTQIGQGFYFTNVKKEAESYTKNVDIYGKVSRGSNPHLHQVYLNITNPFDIMADKLDIEKVKAVYMDGTYDYFFNDWIPFYLNKKVVNGRVLTKADVQAMSKFEKVSVYVDFLSELGTKEILSNMVRAFPYGKQSELLESMKKQLGYDGFVEEFKPGQYQYVAFSPEQVKSVDNTSPTSNPDIRYSLPKGEPAPTFYSHMARVVDGVKQEKLGASSVVSMLRGKGVKAEEIRWSGIEEWLEGKKSVTKAELQEFIAGSMLQIEEEVLDNKDRPYTEDQQKRLNEYEAKRDEIAKRLTDEWKRITGEELTVHNASGIESWIVHKIIDANRDHKNATFEGRLLEKLRNDLEEVIKNNDDFGFDSWRDALRSIHRHRRDFIGYYEMSTNDKAIIVKYCNALNAYNELPDMISDADKDRLLDIAREVGPWNRKIMEVKHEHNEEAAKHMPNWGQYKLNGGKNYREMLFRIPGSDYSNEAMFIHWAERKGVLAHARVQDMDTFIGKMLFIEEIQSDWHNEGHKKGYQDVPDAPFRDTYHEYVMKRLLREAAEQDYDSIGWTTADVQMERWNPKRKTNEQMGITDAKNPNAVAFEDGYRIEYDQDIPKFLNKYAKKWGTTVGKTVLDNGTEVWSMAITDSMKDSVLYDGQVVYSLPKSDTETVSSNPMVRVISGMKQDRVYADSVVNMLRGKGINDEDIGRSGIEAWLDGKTYVFNNELMEFAKSCFIKEDVTEKVYDIRWNKAERRKDLVEIGEMPSLYSKLFGLSGKVYVSNEHLYQNMVSKSDAEAEGRHKKGESIDYHELGEEKVISAILWCQNPIAIMESLNDFQEPRLVSILDEKGKDGNNLIAVLELYTDKTPYGVSQERNHVLFTIYEKSSLPDYVKATADENRVLYIRKGASVDTEASLQLAGAISKETLEHNLSQFIKKIKAFREKNHIDYKLPVGEDTSPRALLANAFEGIITNDIEKRKIQEYKAKVETLNSEEQKLHELRAQIKDLSFSKGPRDTKKLRELRDEATMTANRIATLDKILFGLEASAPLQNILKREKEMAYKRAEQKGKEALEAYKKAERERDQKWQSEVKEKYQASKKKAIETREKREARDKLQKLVLDTVKWISHPAKTDVKCPDILKKPYADFLNGIDLSSQRLANGGDPTKNDLRLANAMGSLATALDKIMISQDPSQDVDKVLDTGYLDLPADFVQKLRDMTENIKGMMVEGDYVVNTMPAAEVRQLSQMIRTLNHAIKTMSNLYANLRFANVEELGFDTMEFMDALGEIEKTGGMKDFVQWDNALPFYAFKRFGKGGESVFEGLMDAQDKLAFLAQEIFNFRDKAWTAKEAKAWSEDTHTIELPNGTELTLTTADAMSIYCLSRREQGLQHLLGGGTRVEGIQKGSKKAKDSRSLLTVKDIDAINSSLTDRQKQVAEAIQEFMSTVCSEWGNEISMKRFLTKEFTEKHYFPIESNDENLTVRDPAAQQSDLFRLLNISATKPLTPGANNEVIIRNIFDVFIGHASDMARLNAYGMGLLDYMKWLNYREKTVNDDGQINVRGVRKSMNIAYGNAAMGYVLNLVKDVNGRPSDGGLPSFYTRMLKNAKTAMVGSSLRVAALQFTSYPRAALVLSPKSLALGLTKIPNINKAKKYCGIALWKSFGFYDTNISRSIEDQMKGVTNVRQKLIELSLKGAEWGDAITWGALWNACEYEVAKTTKNKVGSEEFYHEVGKKLRDVVYRTQVVDSTLTRSQMMRSKNSQAQAVSSFMSEPTLSANIIMDAGFEFNMEKRRTGSGKAAWRKTGNYIARSVAVYSIGQLAGALVESLLDAWRDEEDEKFWEKFRKAFGKNLILDILPLNKIPIISEFAEAALSLVGLGYFSSDDMYSTALTQTLSAINSWASVFKDNSSTTAYNALYKSVRAISSWSGVSFSGVMREAVDLWNNTAGAYDKTLKILKNKRSGDESGVLLYDAIVNENDAAMDRLKDTYKDEDAYHTAVRKALRENDSRIREAALAQINGDPSARKKIQDEIVQDGFDRLDVFNAISAEVNDLKGEEEEDTSTPKEKANYTPDDFVQEFINGDTKALDEIKADIVDTHQLNGKTDVEARKQFASSVVSSAKVAYLEGRLDATGAKNLLWKYSGMKSGDVTDRVNYWDFLLKNPDYEHLSEAKVIAYNKYAKPAYISLEVYDEFVQKTKGFTKQKQMVDSIHALSLTAKQKDALYLSCGYAESGLEDVPWRK